MGCLSLVHAVDVTYAWTPLGHQAAASLFPNALTTRSTSSMILSGVEVPAVMPVTPAPSSHSARTFAAVCT